MEASVYLLLGVLCGTIISFFYHKYLFSVKKRIAGAKEESRMLAPVTESLAEKVDELILDSIFENAPVSMMLINGETELVKANKACKELGIETLVFPKGIKPGNALGCITVALKNQECGKGKECSRCRLKLTIQETLELRTNKSKVPVIMVLEKDLKEVSYNFLISTSYLQIKNSPMVLIVMEDVTSIIKAEKALIESEFRYKQMIRDITDYIYTVLVQANGEILTIHPPSCFKVTGYHAEEFEAKPNLWIDIIHENDRQNVIDFITNANYSHERKYIEHRIVRKDGSICWVLNILSVKAYKKDKTIHYNGLIRDITERKQAEEALENQNKLFNTLLDNLPVGIFMMNAEGKPILANKHAIELMGRGILANADIHNLNETYAAYIAGTNELYPISEMPLVKGLKGLESKIDNLEVEHPGGKRILLEVVGCPVYDKNNTIVASLVGFYDITERKNAEIALRESERKLSIIFEYSHIGISLSDEKGNIQYMNPAFCQLLGYQPDMAFRIFTHPDDVEEENELFNKFRSKETDLLSFEKKYIKTDGQEIWVQMQISCFRSIKGEVTNFIVMAEDISERKKAIDMLRVSEEKFRNIFNTSNDGIVITDLSGNILEVNQIALDRSGLTVDNFKSSNIVNLIDLNDRELILTQLANIKNRNIFFQTSYVNIHGEKLYIEVVGRAINFDGKEVMLMISRDISERKVMQQKILNAIIEAEEKERTYFSQELHDGIGPILSTIKLYLQWIQSPDTKSDKKVLLEDALHTIEDAIVSIKEISNKLSPNVLKKFGLETAIHSFVRKLGNFGKAKFSIDIQLPVRLKQEIETMLYRVFVEAINNSLKYAEASVIFIQISADMNSLTAHFRDDGKGFDMGNPGNIRGNGLFNMQNRVEICEGTFTIKSFPGQGTEIKITLPPHKYLLLEHI